MPTPAFLTATYLSNILVGPPQIIATDTAIPIALDEDTTSACLVTPTVSGQRVRTGVCY